MKLEKFDLEKVIHGAKVVTRDGREVLELTKFENLGELPLVGVVDGDLETWSIKGKYSRDIASNMDLFIVGEVQSIWVNLYTTRDGGIQLGHCYKIKEEAEYDGKGSSSYIKTIEITDEV
jgi:hypothetical protein